MVMNDDSEYAVVQKVVTRSDDGTFKTLAPLTTDERPANSSPVLKMWMGRCSQGGRRAPPPEPEDR